MKKSFITTNNSLNHYSGGTNMKRLLSLVLSLVMLIGVVSGLNLTALANDCDCCEDCTGDWDCCCECGLCDYCEGNSEGESDEGDSDEEDEDDSDEDEDDFDEDEDDFDEDEDDEEEEGEEGETGTLSVNYNPAVEGTDPKETASVYTNEEKTADLENILSYQYSGDSMFWYIKGNTLVVFGRGRMYDYASYKETPWASRSYSNLVVRTGITHISDNAFTGSKIKTVVLPSTVKVIGNNAFADCTELQSIDFGKDLQSIGSRAFYNCKSLKKIRINNNLQFLGESAFENCTSLVSVRFPSTVETIERASFKNCTNLKKAILRTNLVDIKDEAFANCNMLSFVNFPDTVISIGSLAFIGCSSLKTVYFGENLNRISAFAFANSGVENVAVKSNVKTVDATAFQGCTAEIQVYKNPAAYKALNGKSGLSLVCAEHDAKQATTVKANFSRSGQKSGSVCAACGYVIKSTPIAQIFSVSLSKTEFTYNGKAQLPTVKATDVNKKTISNKFYTVKCTSDTKNVGKYAVTVTFTGDYEGSKTLYYTIIPAKSSISKLTAQSKALKVEWKKQTAQVTGYQIQYSTSSAFSSAKTVTVSKNSTTSYTVKSLSAKKKYYVRIRTYKTVGDKKYYSAWSGSKSATTLK